MSPTAVARHPWRTLAVAALAISLWFSVGDRALTATVAGIDPLSLLDTQVPPNVLFVIDNSASMSFTMDGEGPLGADDSQSRLNRAKSAVHSVGWNNRDLVNLGVLSLSPDYTSSVLSSKGPLVYASTSATASSWLTRFNAASPGTSGALPAVTFGPSGAATDYQGASCPATCSAGTCPAACGVAIANSFNNTENGFGAPIGGRYYMKSRLFRNNTKFTFSVATPPTLTAIEEFNCTVALGYDQLPLVDVGGVPTPQTAPPCFALATAGAAAGTEAIYVYRSPIFEPAAAGSCGVVTSSRLASCSARESGWSGLSGAVGRSAWPLTYPNNALLGAPAPAPGTTPTAPLIGWNPWSTTTTGWYAPTAIRDGSPFSLAQALDAAYNYYKNNVLTDANRPPAVLGKQRNFVILVTAALPPDATCNAGTAAADAAAAAGFATRAYDALYGNGSRNVDGIQTLVVALSSVISSDANTAALDRANLIAAAGSGNSRRAFRANTRQEVQTAVRDAVQATLYAGDFSDQQSITDSIFELSDSIGAAGVSALDPMTRYAWRIPIVLQTTFTMPDFNGHLRAWRNVVGPDGREIAGAAWPIVNDVDPTRSAFTEPDAGVALYKRLRAGMGDPSLSANRWTFAQLIGDATCCATDNVATSTAKLKRRILTTTSNGVFLPTVTELMDHTPQAQVVPLWPPTTGTTGVAPIPAKSGNSWTFYTGSLDRWLGVNNYSFDQLRSLFGACEPMPTSQPANNAPALQQYCYARSIAAARMEAREAMLAYTAGAEVVRGSTNFPERDTNWRQLFRLRNWRQGVMAESTLSAPAVVAPPPSSEPLLHRAEYLLYRDGVRDGVTGIAQNGVDLGIGLRNPDADEKPASKADNNLKPVMTVVYHATNSMLHAFRGGPCLVCSENEIGGEELWAFVPFDQLGKLKDRMQPQLRETHTYMLAAPLRFADVWVPGTWSRTIGSASTGGNGVWRSVLLFGRGIGGKYLTALDVTAPGPFTRPSLRTKLPAVLWNRGNPDTTNGLPYDAATNSYNNTAEDYTQYLKMGQTWSVPSVAFVESNKTARSRSVEFVAYLGSGPARTTLTPLPAGTTTTPTNEGQTFYTLDMLTGDVVGYSDIDAGETTRIATNSLTASPAAFNREQLKPGSKTMAAHNPTEYVYIGDLHGRLWRFNSANVGSNSGPAAMTAMEFKNLGPDHPLGVPPALLSYDSDGTGTLRPHLYIETGADNRVFPPWEATPPFKMMGLRDNEDGSVYQLFTMDFPPLFRGTVQPAATYNDDGTEADTTQRKGRVFFVGTKQNPVANCTSSFDSILYAVSAGSGAAVYELPSSDQKSVTFEGQRVNAVRVAGGQLALDVGLGGAPPPPPPPASESSAGPQVEVFVPRLLGASTVCQ